MLAVKTGKRFLKALEDLEAPVRIALSLEEYRELATLKDKIIATLEAFAPENP